MATEFYRYLRPVTFDKTRFQTIAKSTGGVSFLITDFEQCDSIYEVTIAIAVCPVTQAFDKNVAKRILDVRKSAGHTIKVQSIGLDAESLAKAVIHFVDHRKLEIEAGDIFKIYLQHSLDEYADAIEYIIRSQKSADFLSKSSVAALDGLGIGDFYKQKSE